MKKLYPARARLSDIYLITVFSMLTLKERLSFLLLLPLQLPSYFLFLFPNKYFLQFTSSSKAEPNKPPASYVGVRWNHITGNPTIIN
jgi:hypothetical protein